MERLNNVRELEPFQAKCTPLLMAMLMCMMLLFEYMKINENQ